MPLPLIYPPSLADLLQLLRSIIGLDSLGLDDARGVAFLPKIPPFLQINLHMSEKSSKFARKFVKWGVGILETTTTMNNENQNIEYKESWRAEYGQQIVSHVATQLHQEYETKSFELPSKEVLLRQLQKSLAAAKELSTDR